MQKNYLLGDYNAIDPAKSSAVADVKSQADLATAATTGQFSALGKMALFPLFGLVCYLGLIFHFKSKGGWPVQWNCSRMLGGSLSKKVLRFLTGSF